MSNVLKKITKKYKWLRFLNRKVTKLSVLGASLVGLCVSSGASFAKYKDENYGGGNSGLAKLGGGTIYYNYEMNQTPAYLDVNTQLGFYAFIASFRIEFDESELARTFDLELRLSKTPSTDYENYDKSLRSSFVYTGSSDASLPTFITKITEGVGASYRMPNALDLKDEVDYLYLDENKNVKTGQVDLSSRDDTNRKKWEEVDASLNIDSFSPNMLYYGYVADYDNDIIYQTDSNGKTTVKDINYTWSTKTITLSSDSTEKDAITTTNIDFITNGEIGDQSYSIGMEETTLYFSVIFFSEIFSIDGNVTVATPEDTKILYKLSSKQAQ